LGAGTARTAQGVYSPEHKLKAAEIRELSTDPSHQILITSSISLAKHGKRLGQHRTRNRDKECVVEISKNGGNYASMKYSINLATGPVPAQPAMMVLHRFIKA
jgi:hypothetical protein